MNYANDINKIMQEYMDTIAEQSKAIKELKEQAVTFTNLSDMQTELLHKMDADHVSKKELREWCEARIGERTKEHDYSQGAYDVYYVILKRFCKEEV